MNDKDKSLIATLQLGRIRSLAQSRASIRLRKKYAEEFRVMYRQECKALGLNTRPTLDERNAQIKKTVKQLEKEAATKWA